MQTYITPSDKARIERLRIRALQPGISYADFHYRFWKCFLSLDESRSRYDRYAEAYTYAFEHVTPVIDDDELIVGKVAARLTANEKADWDAIRPTADAVRGTGEGQDSHMAVDYSLLLTKGTSGIKKHIDVLLTSCKDDSKREFYETCKACLNAVERFSERYADRARQLAVDAGSERKAELLRIAEICERVPKYPAESFYEAVQSMHFLTLCLSCNPSRFHVCEVFQLGRIDRLLYPYYKADRDAGIIDDAFAQLLIDCLGIMINHRVPSGLSSGYMVGGRNADGTVVANELTYMGIRAIDDISLLFPAVGYCHTSDHPDDLLELACEVLSHGRSHPAIFGDDIIAEGLEMYGVPAADAREYIHSACVEVTPIGASNAWVGSPYTNLAAILLEVLRDSHESYAELYSDYLARLSASIKNEAERYRGIRERRMQTGMMPLLSCFVNDCLERGLDIEKGGARYNWIMPSFIGMANIVDSLYTLKTLVYDEKSVTEGELRSALEANFEGYSELHKRIEKLPKYGNDVEEVDGIFADIASFIVGECKKHTMPIDNSRLIPSAFCFVMHENFGKVTGATPDGRVSGFPLGDGSGPCQGREKCGPTASVLSSTSWSHKEFIGGIAVNMKFSKNTFNDDSLKKIAALVKVYIERGGFEIQINVTGRETLLAAQKEPDKYRDLVVRVGGYSDYFCRLTPEMQAELLLRTEHEI